MMTQVCFRFNKQIIEVIKSFNEEYRFDGITKQWLVKNEVLDLLVSKLNAINVNCILDPYNETEHQATASKPKEDGNVAIKLKTFDDGVLLLEKMKYETYKLFSSQFIKFAPINNSNKEMHHITAQYLDKFYEVCKHNNLQFELVN
jgi:hypothetical protein